MLWYLCTNLYSKIRLVSRPDEITVKCKRSLFIYDINLIINFTSQMMQKNKCLINNNFIKNKKKYI